jgi:hypothetical protein
MRVPTVQATVTLWQQLQIGPPGVTVTGPVARVELAMQINGPDVPLYSEEVVWTLRCHVEGDTDDDPCGSCHGVGHYVALPGDAIADCPYCLGSGVDLVGKGQAVADALLAGAIVQRVIGRIGDRKEAG